ncbi:hypothetical protein D3C86_1849290 [compost metagenome]
MPDRECITGPALIKRAQLHLRIPETVFRWPVQSLNILIIIVICRPENLRAELILAIGEVQVSCCPDLGPTDFSRTSTPIIYRKLVPFKVHPVIGRISKSAINCIISIGVCKTVISGKPPVGANP